MSVSLYRKYRPQSFGDVVGQSSAVSVLTSSISRGKPGHAYLFSGSRGCGKTSAARIFAKALNCLNREGYEPCGKCRSCADITAGESLDVIEIDGASNNGVDNIRGLRENVALAPFSSRYKIYIIDEVHMLTQGAFNALLKTLEEPPEHVIFIMATTEPHKVPVTIRSRCQHIPFRSITPDDIFSRLEYVCKCENITAEPEALREISRQADGALRDALSLLEQVSSSGDITLSAVESMLGTGSRPSFERWVSTLRENPKEAYASLKSMFETGASSVRLFEELFSLVRDIWLVAKWNDIADSLGISAQEKRYLLEESAKWDSSDLHGLMKSVLRVLTEARLGTRADILLGMFMFSLEPSQSHEIPRQEKHYVPATPSVSTQVSTQSQHPAIPESPVPLEGLLNTAFARNFRIYCALYDARAHARGRDLVLEMSHKYCYEVMRIDRTAAELSGMFPEYASVILRYGLTEYVCPRMPVSPTPQGSTTPSLTPPPQAVSLPLAGEARTHATLPSPLLRGDVERSETGGSSSSDTGGLHRSKFGDFLTKLSGMGLKPEVILVKHNEASEADDDINTDTDDTAQGDDE